MTMEACEQPATTKASVRAEMMPTKRNKGRLSILKYSLRVKDDSEQLDEKNAGSVGQQLLGPAAARPREADKHSTGPLSRYPCCRKWERGKVQNFVNSPGRTFGGQARPPQPALRRVRPVSAVADANQQG